MSRPHFIITFGVSAVADFCEALGEISSKIVQFTYQFFR